MKKTEILLVQFWPITHITSEFDFYEKKKTETLLPNFWVIMYTTSEFNFCKTLQI